MDDCLLLGWVGHYCSNCPLNYAETYDFFEGTCPFPKILEGMQAGAFPLRDLNVLVDFLENPGGRKLQISNDE